MLFKTKEDFYCKAAQARRLSSEEEIALAAQMKNGSESARSALIESYLPAVASYVRRHERKGEGLARVYAYLSALTRLVDEYDFSRGREPFLRLLRLSVQKETVRYIANGEQR